MDFLSFGELSLLIEPVLLTSSTTNKGDLLMTNTIETIEKKQPTHLLYIVTPKAGSNESNWLKVGAAWANKDSKGFSLVLEHPLSPNGQYAMMKYEPKAEPKQKA